MNAGEHKDYRIFVVHALVSQAVSSAKKDIITTPNPQVIWYRVT